MTTHDPFTRGSAVTILPGVPLESVPAQRTESTPAPEAQVPAAPVPAGPPAAIAAPTAPPATAFPPAAAVPTGAPMPPVGVPLPPPASALPSAGPAYVPQSQTFPAAPVFDADIPAAPAAFPMDVPVAAAPASPFATVPPPAFPPADAVTPIPAQHAPIPAVPFQPAAAPTAPVPLPQMDIVPDDKQSKAGKRRKEGSGNVSPVKAAAVGAAVIGLAAGWFGHGALSGSTTSSNTPAPVVTHTSVKHAVPLARVSALGSLHVLPKPWVTTGQQALLSSSVVSSTTPAYFGSGGSHGTFAEMGVSVGTLSTVAAARGIAYPAGPGRGTVRCGVNAIDGQATSWCTWKDATSSGMVARFAAPTVTDAYQWTQLVRQTLEP